MAFDFPSGPTNGQEFTPADGPTYVFNGYAWDPKSQGVYVMVAGDTMTGALVLPADPTTALQAATKQYVDAKPSGGAIISDAAPGSPTVGMMWLDSTTMNLYVWYDDSTSQQWVQVNSVGVG